ncbi:MAG: glycosyltransferase family 4 protein [Asgard group archaeon]|nr:glycosyltransferase family 4 protein [Asgard group archaeon]
MENICYVIWKFKSPNNFVNMGGSENQLLKWANHLQKLDKKVTIIARKTDNDKDVEILSENFEIIRINTTNIRYLSMLIFMISLFFVFSRLHRKNKFDIIHVPLPDVYLFTLFFLKRIFKIPIVTTAAGDELNPQRYKGLWYIDRLIVKNLMQKTDCIHTLNELTFSTGIRLNYNKEKLFLIPLGVEIPKKKRNYKKLTNTIVYIGAIRFYPEKQSREIKNLDFLIDSFFDLLIIKPELKLVLVGDGNYKNILVDKVNQLKIQNNVQFVGYQTNIHKYHMIADIITNPSISEGMPNAVIESMASGVFVLCSDIHAHRYIIENNVTGVLFDNTSKRDFIDKVLDFYKNLKSVVEITDKGRLYAIKNFSIESTVKQLLEMYEKVKLQYIDSLNKN